MEKEYLDKLWEIRGNYWEEVGEGWVDCKTCGTQPRAWRFDNGCFAKCICYPVYDSGPVQVESIMSHVHRHGGSCATYEHDKLRVTWNKFAKDGIERNMLPQGLW